VGHIPFVGSSIENGVTIITFDLRQHDFQQELGTQARLCWRKESYHVDVHELSTFHNPKMFHMCWALSDGLSKLISIDEQPNHQIVHLFRLRKAKGATHEPLDPGPEIDVLALDFLRIFLAHVVFLGIDMPLVGIVKLWGMKWSPGNRRHF
jgi:hypothetical protein